MLSTVSKPLPVCAQFYAAPAQDDRMAFLRSRYVAPYRAQELLEAVAAATRLGQLANAALAELKGEEGEKEGEEEEEEEEEEQPRP
jgi:hypothetical protein